MSLMFMNVGNHKYCCGVHVMVKYNVGYSERNALCDFFQI
jgi:hypothetical protein